MEHFDFGWNANDLDYNQIPRKYHWSYFDDSKYLFKWEDTLALATGGTATVWVGILAYFKLKSPQLGTEKYRSQECFLLFTVTLRYRFHSEVL